MTIASTWIDTLLEALDHAGIGVVVTRNTTGDVEMIYVNPAAERIYRRSAEELRRLSGLDTIPASERARFDELRGRVVAGEPAPPVLDTEIVRPDGTRVPVELGLAVQRDGDAVLALMFLRDVSEQRQIQARLLERDRLSTIGALCAGLAHEIYNPLTSVLLHIGGLRKGLKRWVPDPAARVHLAGVLDTIEAGTDRISRSVRELGVFADPACARRGPVDLRGVVEGAARAAAPVVDARARLAMALGVVPPVDADPPRLGQAVMNLIVEAAHAFAAPDRTRNLIEVSLRSEAPWVVVEVADNGCAVDEDRALRAFEPFFPARGAASSGIGLAIARTIVSAIGGTASLVPRTGGGAIATLRLPTASAAG